jgi:hypothetical protein
MNLFSWKSLPVSILAVSAILFTSGCKKSDVTPTHPVTSYTVQGLWAGTATNDAAITIPYFFTVKPDGTCSFEGISAGNEEDFGIGTWAISNNVFTASLTTLYGVPGNIGIMQTVTGTFDSKTGTLTSLTWQDLPSATDHGTFTLKKTQDQVQGIWVGTATNVANITIPYTLTIKADGTCSFEGISAGNEEDFGIGTWTLNGTAFTASLTTLYGVTNNIGIIQTVTGTFDSKAVTLTSLTWKDVSAGATDQGTFTLTAPN